MSSTGESEARNLPINIAVDCEKFNNNNKFKINRAHHIIFPRKCPPVSHKIYSPSEVRSALERRVHDNFILLLLLLFRAKYGASSFLQPGYHKNSVFEHEVFKI